MPRCALPQAFDPPTPGSDARPPDRHAPPAWRATFCFIMGSAGDGARADEPTLPMPESLPHPRRQRHARHGVRRTIVGLLMACAASLALAGDLDVILVRHAEKDSGPAVDATDPPLSAAGRARAAALVEALAGQPPSAIYASQFRRTRETAQAVADALGVAVEVQPINGSLEAHSAEFAATLRERHGAGGTVLVVGHSNTLPALAEALGAQPLPAIAEDEYDRIIRVRVGTDPTSSSTTRYGAR